MEFSLRGHIADSYMARAMGATVFGATLEGSVFLKGKAKPTSDFKVSLKTQRNNYAQKEVGKY
jgi:hypothetical protein